MAFSIGKVYTFNTLSPAFLSNTVERVKLMSIMDAESARTFEPIDQKYAQVYSSLPPGSPKKPSDVTWYLFKAQNGSNVVLADPWIDSTSIEEIKLIDINVSVVRASLSDVDKIRIALSAAGITDFTIDTSQ